MSRRCISNGWLSVAIIVVLLLIDQVIKIWVKTNMALYDTITIFSWFRLHFIENNGMAYGMAFVPKIALSLFRIVAVCLLVYYICRQLKQHARTRYIVLLSLIVAGAAGNIFDSMFYGLIFSNSSPYFVASFVPFGHGYASFLTGKVVDMFYLPIIETTLPEWFPFWGGQPYTFFSPVFNFADACISVGVVLLLLLCRKELGDMSSGKNEEITAEEASHQDQ
jgi:signal peptidase II